MDLKGKVAFITGGGRGIGRETAILLAKQGAKVAVFSRNQFECDETAHIIEHEVGEKALSLVGDVSSEKDVNKAVQVIEEQFGTVDILVNNAGVMSMKPFVEVDVDEWDRVQNVNVRGTYLCTSAVVPQMMKKRSGVIVNISSIWGTKGGPNRSAYITSKWAVIGFTKALGEELKPYKIRVNAVCPGPVDTKMTKDMAPEVDKSDWLKPIDIAHIVVDLCLPKMIAITGATIEAFGSGRPVQLQ